PRAGSARRAAGPPASVRGGGREDGERAFGHPRARRPDRRARPRRRRADLPRRRPRERAAPRPAPAELAEGRRPRAGAGFRRGRAPRSLPAGGMSAELLQLTVAEAAAEISSGELSPEEYFAAWQGAAAGDGLNGYLSRIEDAGAYQVADGPLRGVPVA